MRTGCPTSQVLGVEEALATSLAADVEGNPNGTAESEGAEA